DHQPATRHKRLGQIGFQLAEMRFPSRPEQLADAAYALASNDLLVEIEKRPAEPLGNSAADGRLPGTGEPYEDEMRSTRVSAHSSLHSGQGAPRTSRSSASSRPANHRRT